MSNRAEERKYGFKRAFSKNEGTTNDATITKFGISYNSDGSTTLFAELEKSSAKQLYIANPQS